MTSEMAFECLLVSRDPSVVCTMNRLLGNLSISTNVCLSSSKAFDQVSEGSTDLIIVDWEDDSADLLHKIQKSGRWHKPTVLAVSSRDYPVPGAHVVLRKPVTEASGAMSLKAAYSKMLYDYRRHARYALMSSVQAINENNQSVDVTITDIGDGGVGLSSKEEFAIGEVLCFRLLLPGAERPIYMEARVQWTRDYGASGCEYLRIPPVDLNILHDWLKSKAQIKKPLVEI
ncbi:MAG TPA: PilZ domain-containing protein [Candidatus Dormibacteraeota bacterium]|nr:PilZ domain-containing protein [Candidatus Dormibacteraeota bacterium]